MLNKSYYINFNIKIRIVCLYDLYNKIIGGSKIVFQYVTKKKIKGIIV